MLIPKTDKWVLVRWHGGVRSVVKAKYLLKFLPPGEDLKISTVVKVSAGNDGKPDTAVVLTSGNERHQLELLSEPGERPVSPDEESPELEQDKNDQNEASEEDFEESSSDWTPEDLDFSSDETDSSDNDKDTSKKNKTSSQSSPKKNAKNKSGNLSAVKQKRKEMFEKTAEKLTRLYMKTDRELALFEKRRVEGKNNVKNQDNWPKQMMSEGDKRMDEVITYMNTVFAGLFKVIVSNDPDLGCPAECKKVKVDVSDTGDVVIRDKKYYKKHKRRNKQISEYFDKTLTPYETDDNSENKETSEVFDKTLTPHESDDETLATISKKITRSSIQNKKTPELCEDKETSNLLKNNRTSTPAEDKKVADASIEDYSSDGDYSSDRSDDPVLISNKYETVDTSHNKPEAEWIPIGSGTTLIHKDKFAEVNWKSYTKATRSLLRAAFSRKTLATHSLTGKKSPAFSHKPAKMCLDPKIVSDIVIEVGDKFKVRDNLVRNIITTKCADECKMRKMKMEKKKALKLAKLALAENDTNDVENNNPEKLPTPKKTTKSCKKNNQKSTPPKRKNTRRTGKKYNKKTSKIFKYKIQEIIMPPENDTKNSTHPYKQENVPLTDNDTKDIVSEKEENILPSDDDAMVIDEEYYSSPSETNSLKSIENKNQVNLPPENTRMSMDNNEEYTTTPVNMSMKSENQENIPPPENNTSKSIKNRSQENIILPPVKKTVKGYKTYRNKSKIK